MLGLPVKEETPLGNGILPPQVQLSAERAWAKFRFSAKAEAGAGVESYQSLSRLMPRRKSSSQTITRICLATTHVKRSLLIYANCDSRRGPTMRSISLRVRLCPTR